MQNSKVIVFATSLLDEPVAGSADSGRGREIPAAAGKRHDVGGKGLGVIGTGTIGRHLV